MFRAVPHAEKAAAVRAFDDALKSPDAVRRAVAYHNWKFGYRPSISEIADEFGLPRSTAQRRIVQFSVFETRDCYERAGALFVPTVPPVRGFVRSSCEDTSA